MYKIAAENLQALLHKIAADRDLYLPVKVSDQVNFKAWSEDAEVCLDTLKTVKSPKDAFFPQSENLYTCKKEEKNISIEPQALQEKDFVVFGMKACAGAAGKDLQRRGLQSTAGEVGRCHRAAERCEQQDPVVHRNGY